MIDLVVNGKRIKAILLQCQAKPYENPRKILEVKGVGLKVHLQLDRLEKNRSEIEAMLDQLPDSFKESRGGGDSFLNLHEDSGKSSTIDATMERLLVLGIGIGKVRCMNPYEEWHRLPGGKPCFVILDKPKTE